MGGTLMPTELMIRRLRVNSTVSEDDASALRALPSVIKNLPAGSSIIREGDRPTQCVVIQTGFAFRAKTTISGKRQILSFHPAGDMPDLHGLLLERMDHDLATLSDAQVGFIEHRHINKLIEERPQLARALWKETLVDAAIFRAWIVNLGSRSAAARLANLIAEIRQRLEDVGLPADRDLNFPVTQSDLADALGITDIHMNRILQTFRTTGILDVKRKQVTLRDLEKLLEIGGFDDRYLHP
jgi:CRP-like cAMP-binding protein